MFYFTQEIFKMLLKKNGLDVELSCFYEYGLRNFLQWYYVGKPGQKFDEEISDNNLFSGCSKFETMMNEMMQEMNVRFKEIMKITWGGDTIRAIARKKR